jgi:hypothetical protein
VLGRALEWTTLAEEAGWHLQITSLIVTLGAWQVFKVLLDGLFTSGAQLSHEDEAAHVELLALAAAAVDDRSGLQPVHVTIMCQHWYLVAQCVVLSPLVPA